MGWRSAFLLFSGLLACRPLTALGQAKPSEVAVHLGAFGVLDGLPGALEGGIEVRLPARRLHVLWRDWHIEPIAGGALSNQGMYFAYAGLRHERVLSPLWVLGLSFAAGVFEDGGGRDLHGRIEFRSAIDLAARLPGEVRLGVTFDHLSHAGFYGRNPGSESLLVTITAPLQVRPFASE